MINSNFFKELDALEKEGAIDKEVFIDALEQGLSSAYRKQTGELRPVMVKLNPEKRTIRVYAYQDVVEEVVDPDKEISLEDARRIKKSYQVGDRVTFELDVKEFSRIAAQTAKQVIVQILTTHKKEKADREVADKEGEVLSTIIRRVEKDGTVYVEFLKLQMEGILQPQDQIRGERYRVGDTLRVYLKKLKQGRNGMQIYVSRSSPLFLKKLFEMEIPEIKTGLIVIKKVAREAGQRSKIAVYSDDVNVDAVGSCIGPRGSRINVIVSELNGERIDVVEWSSDPLRFIANAISPARAVRIQGREDDKSALVIVNDDVLSLAIGKGGLNAKLAARLTEWKIDIKPISETMTDLSDESNEDDDE